MSGHRLSRMWDGLQTSLPPQILQDVLDTAFSAYGNRIWVGSGLLLLLGFLWRIHKEKWAFVRGETDRPDYVRHMLALAGYTALLAAYQPVTRACMHIVSHLAQGFTSGEDLGPALLARAKAVTTFWDHVERPFFMSLEVIFFGTLWFCAQLCLVVSGWAVWSLKTLQTFILAVIVVYGPVALSFSFLGGLFANFGNAWFLALIEISAWSFTFDILSFILTPMVQHKTHDIMLFNELGLCVVLLVLIRSVPKVTAMLVRGASSSVQSAGSPVAAVMAAARMVKGLR